jgi:hypothetical protein
LTKNEAIAIDPVSTPPNIRPISLIMDHPERVPDLERKFHQMTILSILICVLDRAYRDIHITWSNTDATFDARILQEMMDLTS